MTIAELQLDDAPPTAAPPVDAPAAVGDAAPATGAAVVRRGVWGLADQGVVSMGSFLTNLVLARALSPTQYGTYGLILGVMLLLNNLHASLVTYPLSVKGAASSADSLSALAGGSMVLSLALSPAHWIGVIIISALTHHLSLAPFIAAALLCWQVQETVRRALMAHLRFRDAVWGDAVAYLLQAAILWAATRRGTVSLATAFTIIALTSGSAALIQAAQLRLRSMRLADIPSLARAYFKIGRWMALTNLTNILNIQAVPWTLAASHGVAESAKLQATGNILGVTHPAVFGISNMMVPATSKARREGGLGAVRKIAVHFFLLGAVLTLPYYLALLFWPGLSLRLFYGHASPYLHLHWTLRIFAAAYLLNYLSATTAAVLNGLEKTRSVFVGQLAGAATTLLVSVPLAAWGGVEWALVGGCASIALQIAINVIALARVKGLAPSRPASVGAPVFA